jgi:PAS domain S-box-containing protein
MDGEDHHPPSAPQGQSGQRGGEPPSDLDESRCGTLIVDDGIPETITDAPKLRIQRAHAPGTDASLERRRAAHRGLTQGCVHEGKLALLGGVAEALAENADPVRTVRDKLAKTLDAAGIAKWGLFMEDRRGRLALRHSVGFLGPERILLADFFGHRELLKQAIDRRATGFIPGSAPSSTATGEVDRRVMEGAGAAALQIVPLVSGAHASGAIVLAAEGGGVTSEAVIDLARALGVQAVQALELADTFARLSASEQRYRTLLDRASDAIAVVDEAGGVREVNRRWEEILDLPREQILGRNIRSLLASGDGLAWPQPALGRGPAAPDRGPPVHVQRPDGTTVLMDLGITALELDGARCLLTVGRDLTDRAAPCEPALPSDRPSPVGLLAGVAQEINRSLMAVMGNLDRAAAELDAAALRVAGAAEVGDIAALIHDARWAAERMGNVVGSLHRFARAEESPPAVAVRERPTPAVSGRGVAAAARRARILVVNDELLVGRILRRSLSVDHEVTLVPDGGEALTRIEGGERYDVIVCDLMMPFITGMEIHTQLLAVAPDQAARMVFLSGGAFSPRVRAFLDQVPNPRLDKPFEMQALRDIVDQRLKHP